ncbi:hypothetical protein PAPYR_10576 [Paratrimastix pyriformis]|uniref:Uncharacterized protein n=1 Tax=Paratrimastix pyriformis TaxID=342808 RepID=A0ABQ8U8I7_9EUKA|nr:hypothetical protein PAPYR_10576 [Paratrimastix pyriformis]
MNLVNRCKIRLSRMDDFPDHHRIPENAFEQAFQELDDFAHPHPHSTTSQTGAPASSAALYSSLFPTTSQSQSSPCATESYTLSQSPSPIPSAQQSAASACHDGTVSCAPPHSATTTFGCVLPLFFFFFFAPVFINLVAARRHISCSPLRFLGLGGWPLVGAQCLFPFDSPHLDKYMIPSRDLRTLHT